MREPRRHVVHYDDSLKNSMLRLNPVYIYILLVCIYIHEKYFYSLSKAILLMLFYFFFSYSDCVYQYYIVHRGTRYIHNAHCTRYIHNVFIASFIKVIRNIFGRSNSNMYTCVLLFIFWCLFWIEIPNWNVRMHVLMNFGV